MKFSLKSSLLIGLFFIVPIIQAQDIEVITHELTKYEPVGTAEIILNFEIVNVSPDTQVVFEVRTINNLPANWTSSLCFGDLCFSPFTDSVATTQAFNTPAPGPGDTVETSLHFFTDMTSVATGYVQIQIGTLQHPEDRVILNLTGTTDPTLDVNEAGYLNSYYLAQNYPNPFNPATKISYKIDEPGFVQLKVYNVLGVEVKSLINEFKNSGEYSINFDASSLYSGVYFYTLSVNNFTQTRKMILEK